MAERNSDDGMKRKEQTMSMISELIEKLIDNADLHTKELHDLMYEAADTIEMLSEKVRDTKQGEWTVNRKEYDTPKGKVVFSYDGYGIGRITLECMDMLMDMVTSSMWIPCSERLPEHTHPWGAYLITFGASNIVAMACYRYGRWKLQGNDLDVTDAVMAWMPLPEPWKGADNEKRL